MGEWLVASCRRGHCRVAFSLIELIVVLGIVMVLIGLLLPSLAAARERSRMTRLAVTARSNALAVVAYAGDHDDVYPIASADVGNAMLDWDDPLIAEGILPSKAAVDPDGVREHGGPKFALSGALVHPSRFLESGATLPIDLAKASPIRQSEVAYPSQKGMMVRWLFVRDGVHTFWTWNPYDRPIAPVAWTDGHVSEHRCTDFALAYPYFENWVGHPVVSTWLGTKGADRLALE